MTEGHSYCSEQTLGACLPSCSEKAALATWRLEVSPALCLLSRDLKLLEYPGPRLLVPSSSAMPERAAGSLQATTDSTLSRTDQIADSPKRTVCSARGGSRLSLQRLSDTRL